MLDNSTLKAVAKGRTKDGQNFIFWNYSGKPPGAGPSDNQGHDTHGHRRTEESTETEAAEPPRWRSSSTVALWKSDRIAYKVKDGDVIGIYHWTGGEVNSNTTIVETGEACTLVDDQSPSETLIESVAMERDSYRGGNLVVSVACAEPVVSDGVDVEEEEEEIEGWGGIYLTCLQE